MYEGYSTELYHHGILGQKWGVRRFQNPDGSLTREGMDRYNKNGSPGKTQRAIANDLHKGREQNAKNYRSEVKNLKSKKRSKEITKDEYKEAKRNAKSNLIKEDKKEEDAAYKAFVQTTSRGRNIATGLLQSAAGLTLLSAANSKVSAPEVNKLAAGILGMGLTIKGATKLINEVGATGYRPDKTTEREQTKKAVSDYKKQWEKTNSMMEKSEQNWKDVKSQYNNLSDSRIGKIKEVGKAQSGKGSEAANKYLKTYDKASNYSDKVYEEKMKTKDLYTRTGKSRVGRVINNIRYR